MHSPLSVKRHSCSRSGPLPCGPTSRPPPWPVGGFLSYQYCDKDECQEKQHDTNDISGHDRLVTSTIRSKSFDGEVEASMTSDIGNRSRHEPDPQPPDVREHDVSAEEPGDVPTQGRHLLQSSSVTSSLPSLQGYNRVQTMICKRNWINLYTIADTNTHHHDPGSTGDPAN